MDLNLSQAFRQFTESVASLWRRKLPPRARTPLHEIASGFEDAIVPQRDMFPHKETSNCPCRPLPLDDRLLHRAFDGRETLIDDMPAHFQPAYIRTFKEHGQWCSMVGDSLAFGYAAYASTPQESLARLVRDWTLQQLLENKLSIKKTATLAMLTPAEVKRWLERERQIEREAWIKAHPRS